MTKKYTEEELAPLLTDEFLALLAIAVKTCGWHMGDYMEVCSFIEYIFDVAGKECPDLTPYKDY